MSIFIVLSLIGLKAMLAIIPNYIADEKGYNKAAFYILGFFFFPLATVLALVLPDKNNGEKKTLDGNVFNYLTRGIVVMYFHMIVSLMECVSFQDDMELVDVFRLIVPSVALFIAISLCKKLGLAIVLYGLASITTIMDLEKYSDFIMIHRVDEFPPIVPLIFQSMMGVLVYAILIIMICKYLIIRKEAKDCSSTESLSLSFCLAPFCLAVVSRIIDSILAISLAEANVFLNLVLNILYCIGILYIGLLYYEDSQYQYDRREDALSEEQVDVVAPIFRDHSID